MISEIGLESLYLRIEIDTPIDLFLSGGFAAKTGDLARQP